MRLPPLCRYLRFWGVRLEDRGADLGPFLGVSLESCVDTSVLKVFLVARGADLGSLLGVSVKS